jgi:hypothetical protein
MFLHAGTVSGPYTDTQMSAVADEVFTDFSDVFKDALTNDTHIQSALAEDLTTGSAAAGLSSGASVVGVLGGSIIPSGSAVVLNFGISSRYRGGHPRVYLPPPNTTFLNDARSWSSSFRSGTESGWNSMLAAIQASTIGTTLGLGQVAVRYQSGGVPLVPPQRFDVAVVTASPIIGSQRRRYNR